MTIPEFMVHLLDNGWIVFLGEMEEEEKEKEKEEDEEEGDEEDEEEDEEEGDEEVEEEPRLRLSASRCFKVDDFLFMVDATTGLFPGPGATVSVQCGRISQEVPLENACVALSHVALGCAEADLMLDKAWTRAREADIFLRAAQGDPK